MTITVERFIGGERYIEGFCVKSTDTLPTDNIAMGSKMFAIDENTTYYYKDEADGWVNPAQEEA